jgi:protein-tyrosine phosphatase
MNKQASLQEIKLTPMRKAKRTENGTFLVANRKNSPYDGVDITKFEPLDNERNKQNALSHLKSLYNYQYLDNHPEKKAEQNRRIYNHQKNKANHIKSIKKANHIRYNIQKHQNFILN